MMTKMFHHKPISSCLLILFILALPAIGSAGESRNYPKTTGVLKALYANGIATWNHYKAYEQQAQEESLHVLATLFAAMAASQSVATDRFGRLLAEIDGVQPRCLVPPPTVAITQSNLRMAIEMEFLETDVTFPRALRQLNDEGYRRAIQTLRLIIAAQRHHRLKLESIYPYTTHFFGAFTSKIKKHNPTYYICTQTGAVILDKLPANCPIQGGSPSAYIHLLEFKTPVMMETCRWVNRVEIAG